MSLAGVRPPHYLSTLHRAPLLKDLIFKLEGTRSSADGRSHGGQGARRGSCGSQHSRHCAWPPGEGRATASRHPRPLPCTACCQETFWPVIPPRGEESHAPAAWTLQHPLLSPTEHQGGHETGDRQQLGGRSPGCQSTSKGHRCCSACLRLHQEAGPWSPDGPTAAPTLCHLWPVPRVGHRETPASGPALLPWGEQRGRRPLDWRFAGSGEGVLKTSTNPSQTPSKLKRREHSRASLTIVR